MKEEHAFMSESFPCNAIPFLTRIREILDKGNTNAFDSLSAEGKLKAVANGVPIPTGRAIARAVRDALANSTE